MAKMNGKIIQRNGKSYWVSDNPVATPEANTDRHQEPMQNKIIPMGKLTKAEKELLRDAHSYIHIDEYYKHKEFLKCYREFHKSTGGKYIEGGFDKFKVACVQARRTIL